MGGSRVDFKQRLVPVKPHCRSRKGQGGSSTPGGSKFLRNKPSEALRCSFPRLLAEALQTSGILAGDRMAISQCSEPKMLGEGRAKARGWSRAESSLSNRTQEPLLGEGVSTARRHHPKRAVTCSNKSVTRGTLIQLSAH